MTDRTPTTAAYTEADVETMQWLVWFARKSKGTARDVARLALDQNPELRLSEARSMNGCDANAAVLVAEARAPLEAERDLWKRDWAIKDKQWTDALEARAPLEAEIERLRRIETAARNLLAPDLDAIGRQYHISSTEPDFLALRAALEEPTP